MWLIYIAARARRHLNQMTCPFCGPHLHLVRQILLSQDITISGPTRALSCRRQRVLKLQSYRPIYESIMKGLTNSVSTFPQLRENRMGIPRRAVFSTTYLGHRTTISADCGWRLFTPCCVSRLQHVKRAARKWFRTYAATNGIAIPCTSPPQWGVWLSCVQPILSRKPYDGATDPLPRASTFANCTWWGFHCG